MTPCVRSLLTRRVQHVASRKHRKFAEDDENWAKLDVLLETLQRVPKYSDLGDYE